MRERSRGRLATALVAAAGLARETSVVAAAGLVRRPWLSWANVARVAAAAAPLAAWLLYIRWVFGANDAGLSNFSEPFAGLVGKVAADVDAVRHHGDSLLALTTLVATCGLIVQAAYFVAPPDLLVSPRPEWSRENDAAWWRIGAAYAVLMICLGTAVWRGFPGAGTRVLLPMSLAFNVRAARRRAALVWLLAGNLTVLNGMIVMRDVPHDPRELAAARVQGGVIIARAGDGWFDAERTWRHTAAWSRPDSTIELEMWPHETRTVQIEASAHSRTPFLLTVTQGDTVLWRSTVFPRPTTIAISCIVRDGHARIDVSANVPGVRDAPNPADRPPVFAMEDVRFAMR